MLSKSGIALILLGILAATVLVSPTTAQPAGWSGDDNLAFQLTVNGVSAAESDANNPIPVDAHEDINMLLEIQTGDNLTLKSGLFSMKYLGFNILEQDFNIDTVVPAGTTVDILNSTVPTSELVSFGNISLVSGTLTGRLNLTYSLLESPSENTTVSESFVVRLGPTGAAAIFSVSGLLTAGFTVMSIFSILLALDEFQQGILGAMKVRSAESDDELRAFPRPVILRRIKKDREKISKNELVQRVRKVIENEWHPREEAAEMADKVSAKAPRALNIVGFGSKVPVGTLAKKLDLKPDEGGALAAALTDLGILQTKTVKVPLFKVMLAGATLAGSYVSWNQIFGGVTPSWVDVLLLTAGGLVVSVLIAYIFKWLARMPELGYE